MKLVVNTLLGLGMQSIAEAVALGSGLGLPRDMLLDTLARTAVVAPTPERTFHCKTERLYTAVSNSILMRKDFGLILTAAAECGLFNAHYGSGSGG